MYFSKATLKTKDNLKELFKQDNYSEHQLLWKLFERDRDAKRDFLYHKIEGAKYPTYYVLSDRKPENGTSLWHIGGIKTYNPQLSDGQSLRFILRANTVTALKEEGKRGKVIDVVTYEKIKMEYRNLPFSKKPPLQELIRKGCMGWLKNRTQKSGFDFDEGNISVNGYRKNIASSPKKEIIYYSADFSGILTVTNVDDFKAVLSGGLGKCKAFGCGMFLIRKA